jgi:hypothetical protein
MDKLFEVKIEAFAKSKKQVEDWLEKLPVPNSIDIEDVEVVDEDERHLEARIRYDENYMNDGEHYVFENRWSDEEEWGMEMAFKLIDDRLSYQALTKIREWKRLGIPFYFA